MSSLSPLPSDRLSELVGLISAWNAERNEQHRASYAREKPVSKLAPVLLAAWNSWASALEKEGKGLPESEKKNLVKAYDQLLKTNDNATWSNRHALADLEREVAGDRVPATLNERLHETLLTIGCWPEVSLGGKPPASLKPFGPYASQLNTATENSQAGVLKALLDWEGSGEASVDLLQSRQTGISPPSGFHHSQQTGWSWAVRNTSTECLGIWIDAGADPNAVDRKDRPVLAYVQKPDSLELLLKAGADPLNPGLPLEERRKNLLALWEGWKTQLYWQEGHSTSGGEWGLGLEYLRVRLAQWSHRDPEDFSRATADMLLSAYVNSKRPSGFQKSPWLANLAKELGRVSELDPHQEATIRDRTWSFAGALARGWLLDTAFVGTAPKLPRIDPGREIVAGVQERTLASLVSLSDEEKTAQTTLSKLGSANVSGALVLMMEEASATNEYWDERSLLVRRTRQVLGLASRMGPAWMDAMVPVVDAAFKTLNGQWDCSVSKPFFKAQEAQFFLQWALKNRDALPVRAQIRWFVQGLGAYQPKDEPLAETPLVQEALLEAAVKDLEFLKDPSLKNGLKLAFSRHPGLEKAIQSALAQETLEESLPPPPSSAPKKPRF